MTTTIQCPICELDNCKKTEGHLHDQVHFHCLRCRKFKLTGSLNASIQSYIQSTDDRWKLSHWLRTNDSASQEQSLDTSIIKAILERSLPSLAEQSDLLLKWLAGKSEDFGKAVTTHTNLDFVVIGAKSLNSFLFVIDALTKRGLIKKFISAHEITGKLDPEVSLTLTVDGWEQVDHINQNHPSYRRAFMAMKFSEPQLDQIVATYFKPAAAEAGFELLRLDDNPSAGLIDNRMRVEIRNADFVIADLTHDNLGAYWEAGYAEGLGKPVIYTCEKTKFEKQKTHFDTNHHLTILWDPEDPNKAAEELKATIRATLPNLAKLQ